MEETSIDNQNIGTKPVPYSTAVLVLGIISIPTCICYGIPGLATGIVALVLAAKGKRAYEFQPEKYKESSFNNLKAGKVCAIIGTCLSAFWLLYFVFAIIFAFSTVATPFMY